MASKKELERRIEGLYKAFNDLKSEFETNGVATAINKLNREVFQPTKAKEGEMARLVATVMGEDAVQHEPTLMAKVDALMQNAKLNLEVVHNPAKEASVTIKPTIKKTIKKTVTRKPRVIKKGKK